jgi:chromosome segregation ATPase
MRASDMTRWALGMAFLAILGSAVAADSAKGGKEKEMARRLQMLQQEKAELGVKLKEANTKAEELTKAVEEGKQELDQSQRELAAVQRKLTETKGQLTRLQSEHASLKVAYEDKSTQLAQREKEKRFLEGVTKEQLSALGLQSRKLEICRASNDSLYSTATELLDKHRSDGMRNTDHVLGFSEVSTFNTYQDYRDRFDGARADGARETR